MGCILLVCIACVVVPVVADSTPVLNVPTAVFAATPISGTAPLTVQFTDQSTNSPISWSWAFGDGNKSTIQSPSYTYNYAGSYSASLIATNSAGSSTNTATQTITVNAPIAATTTATTTATPLVASFTASPTSGTAPLTVQFMDTSTGSPTTWDWSFGDGGTNSGNTASNESPSYTYTTAGTYSVYLTIGDGGVLPSSTSTQTTTITVNAGATTTSTVPAVTSVSPTYGPVSTGTTITITGTGFTGATAVTVGGTEATSFTVVSDTEITATTPAEAAGTVDVIVTTPSGTSSAVAGDKYTFAAAATTVPLPIFYGSPMSGTAPLTVQFTDESTGNPASWSWNFGDGNTSTLENPTNTYINNGTYSVSLTEENSLGSNTTTMTGYIVIGPTIPVAAFEESPTSGNPPLNVQFTDESTGSPTSWAWTFGDGGTSNLQNPSKTYQNAGTYTVTLTVTNSEGTSTNIATQTITVGAGGATTIPTSLPTTAPTFAIGATSTTGSVNSWLAQQQAIATATPTPKSPGYDVLSALIGCGVVAGIALYRKY